MSVFPQLNYKLFCSRKDRSQVIQIMSTIRDRNLDVYVTYIDHAISVSNSEPYLMTLAELYNEYIPVKEKTMLLTEVEYESVKTLLEDK
jgi:hypothetical protein